MSDKGTFIIALRAFEGIALWAVFRRFDSTYPPTYSL
jgi:hypothetical protein